MVSIQSFSLGILHSERDNKVYYCQKIKKLLGGNNLRILIQDPEWKYVTGSYVMCSPCHVYPGPNGQKSWLRACLASRSWNRR